MAKDDDEAWRAIVDNYGDRAELDDEQAAGQPVDVTPEFPDEDVEAPTPVADPRPRQHGWDDEFVDADWASDRFVPPTPPPVPRTTPDRLAAWIGVFGSPLVLLACLLAGIDLPQLLAYVLVAGFVGGFLYLVLKMPREPRDPGDDGAVL